MGLKPCRECGPSVSTNAKPCPHLGCGVPVKDLSWDARRRYVFLEGRFVVRAPHA